MPFIPPEIVEEARQIDLLTYLQNYEPGELMKSGGEYCTRTHDSLKISHGKWMWWSRGFGGASALDYLIKVQGLSFSDAVHTILDYTGTRVPVRADPPPKEPVKKELLLPERSPTSDVITDYLFGRGIDLEIIRDCIDKGLIFESLPYHNLVCVGFDEAHTPRYAAFRATNQSRIMGDCTGSNKHYSFCLPGSEEKEIHLFESSIDALSYATLLKRKGQNWREKTLLSLAGVYMPKEQVQDSKVPSALLQLLKTHPRVQRIILHLDNDKAGRLASGALQATLSDIYEVVDDHPKYGKDINDFLCFELRLPQLKNHQERKYER